MTTQLYDFQKRAVEFHLSARYSLNLCPMGYGKTLMAIETARRVNGRATIICPSFLERNWRAEIAKHYPELSYSIVTYSQLSRDGKLFIPFDPKIVIADEVHYAMNPQSKRTRNLAKLLEDYKPEYFIGLTGTPIRNRIAEYYAPLSIVSLSPTGSSGIDVNRYFRNRDHFASRYCDFTEFTVGRAKVKKWGNLLPHRTEEFKTLLKGKVFRVSDKDTLSLPPLIHKNFTIDMMSDVDEDLLAEFESFDQGLKNSKAKKESAILKAPYTAEYVDNILDEGGGPVLVFTDHIESAHKIAAAFQVKAITGGTPASERAHIVDIFNRGELSVLVATIGSLSVGVNLTRASNLVFNDCSWVPADNLQAMKRIHRIGQTKPCVVHYTLSGHVDAHILDLISKKMYDIDKTNLLAVSVSS